MTRLIAGAAGFFRLCCLGRPGILRPSLSLGLSPTKAAKYRKGLCIFVASIFILGSHGAAQSHDFDSDGPTFDLLFLGDTSFGENYQDRLKAQGKQNVLQTQGYDYAIETFAELLRSASMVVANLETPITDLPDSPFSGIKSYIHYADVEKTPDYLRKYDIDMVSLANNHSLDFGLPGLSQTQEILEAHEIETCGAGETEDEARRIYSHEITVGQTEVEIALICAFEYRKKYDHTYRFYAKGDLGGTNPLFVDRLALQIRELRRRNPEVFVIAFLHWGRTYRLATEKQRRLAHSLIEAEADLIIGHGAHRLQELEHYKGRWIIYSLGNFVFLSPGRFGKLDVAPYGMIARLTLDGRDGGLVKTLRFYPIFSDNRVSNYRSRFVTKAEFDEVWGLLAEHSVLPSRFDSTALRGRDDHGWYVQITLD
jgi:hypothetical protein